MNMSRRFFVIGSGAVVTSAFAKDAVRFVERTSRPLLIAPDQVETDLFYYDNGESFALTVGPYQSVDDVPVPTWREYYAKFVGRPIETEEDIKRIWQQDCISREEIDCMIPDQCWAPYWEYYLSPNAQAYQLLQSLDLGPLRKRSGLRLWKGHLIFDEFLRPGDSSRIADAQDAVTLSLLQARLIELKLPWRLREGQ